VFAPNKDCAASWIIRLHFAYALSMKIHDDQDRTKYTLERMIPVPTSMQYTPGRFPVAGEPYDVLDPHEALQTSSYSSFIRYPSERPSSTTVRSKHIPRPRP
jgi:hypothetical protein